MQSRGSKKMFERRHLFSTARFAVSIFVLGAFSIVGSVRADVVTIGAVSPTPPVNGGTFTGLLTVGNGTNEESNDLWGWVEIDDGTLLQYGSVILGDNEQFIGQINISGDFLGGQITQFNLSGTGSSSQPVVQVGNEGTGYLNIDGGARLTLTNQSADFAVGLEPTGVGSVTASDQFTMITAPDTMVIGQAGIGTLNVLNGAMVRTLSTSRSDYISIGRDLGSVGTAVVDGSGSLLRATSTLRVGESGAGSLTIRNGATALAIDGNVINSPDTPFVGIGMNNGSVGYVTVEGSGSRLQARRAVVIGGTDGLTGEGTGLGTLTIRNGGLVQIVDQNLSTVNVGPFGRLEMDGGSLFGSAPVAAPAVDAPEEYGTVVNGYVGGSGLIRGSVYIGGFATAGANSGDKLQFDGVVLNQGSININAGEIQFFREVTNNAALPGPTPPAAPAGRISIENGGTLRLPAALNTVNDGVITNSHGTTNVYGRITNNGDIVVARDTVASFFDTLTNNGTVTILPGGNLLELANMSFQSMAMLQLGVGSAELNDGNSQVSASGVIELGGALQISLDGGLESFLGQSVQLISAGGGIVGQFDEIQLPLVPNDVDVNLVYGPTGVSMQIMPLTIGNLPGDYNSDGIVDAADYTVWRDNLGSTTSLPNDDTPGVGPDDYTRWKTNFGQEAIVGSGAVTSSPSATPEPSCAILLAAALPAAWAVRRRRFARVFGSYPSVASSHLLA
jgi:T5SS/PEP-CTERM-associated repeat protein